MATYAKDYNYLVPKGRDGLFWDPEIKDVIQKYAQMGVDIANAQVQENLVTDIAEAIRAIPLETVRLCDPPVRHLDSASNEFFTFPDGTSTEDLVEGNQAGQSRKGTAHGNTLLNTE